MERGGGGEFQIAAAEPDENELLKQAERLRREALAQKPAVTAPAPKKRHRVLMGTRSSEKPLRR
jgi:hypothetical protein